MDRRLQELLEWLTNFYEFDFIKGVGTPHYIIIKEVIGEYQPLPRKKPNQDSINQEKKEKYTRYTIASLGPEYKPNSKSKIARDAIEAFGYKDFGHISSEAVAKRFIKEPFNLYGETNGKKVWAWYDTYIALDEEKVEAWRRILKEEHMSEEEAASAWYKQESGEDVSKEKGYYKNAIDRAKMEWGSFPVYIQEWRLKRN